MKSNSRFAPPRRRRSVAAASVFLGIAGVIASCGADSSNLDALPPLSVGSLAQGRLLEGETAMDLVNQMHPLPIAPSRSWVAYYGGGAGVTVYASKFADATEAETALGKMRAGMADPRSGFGITKPLAVAKQNGYSARGLNREHFFFIRGPWLIWIEGHKGDFAPAVGGIRWAKAAKP